MFDSATQAAKRANLEFRPKFAGFATGVAKSNTVKHKLVNTNPNTTNTVFDQSKTDYCH